MIVRLTQHKTVPAIVVVQAGQEMAHDMGRFEFAKWQPQHKAYWVEERHIDTMRRELERKGHTVIDDRHQAVEEKYLGPLPECRSCGAPAGRKASMALNRCPSCGDAWHPVIHQTPGLNAALRAQCEGCGHRQGTGRFCGQCGCTMPAPEPVGTMPAGFRVHPPNQDPLPVAQTIAELDLEEPERERYP